MLKKTCYILSALGLGLSVSCATPPGPDIRAAAGLADAVQFRTESLPTDAPPIGNALDLLDQVEGRTYHWKPELGRDGRTLYRARVVGVTRDAARAACATLEQHKRDCLAVES